MERERNYKTSNSKLETTKIKIINLAKLIKKVINTKSIIKIDNRKKRFDDFDLDKVKKIAKKDYLTYKNIYSLKKGILKLSKEY